MKLMVQAIFGFDRIPQTLKNLHTDSPEIQRSDTFAIGIFRLKYSLSEGRKT